MELKEALILDVKDPVSKALNELLKTGTAVIVTKDNKYFGILDDRHLGINMNNASKTKCETEAIKV